MGETAELSDKRYVQQKIGVVDVGFRTTDYTVSDKTKYSGRGSGSSESGIARAFAMIAAKLLEQNYRRHLLRSFQPFLPHDL